MIRGIKYGVLCCFLVISFNAVSQLPDKVGSLLTADRTAARLSATEGPYAAFLSMVDDNSTFFTPKPVNAVEYLKNRPNIPDVLTWDPTFAAISKSMEWGVTSGSFTFQRIGAIKRYGEYLTVWRRDRKGVWKVDLRAQIEHHGTTKELAPFYIEPDTAAYMQFRTKERIAQRKEIVQRNDQLLSTVLRSNAEVAYEEFLANDVRFFYPWTAPLSGKENVINFLKKQDVAINAESLVASRSYSGELAYSYGTADIASAEQTLRCNYVRIWQLQPDFQWKVIIEMLFER